jgi:hypothetical protein
MRLSDSSVSVILKGAPPSGMVIASVAMVAVGLKKTLPSPSGGSGAPGCEPGR